MMSDFQTCEKNVTTHLINQLLEASVELSFEKLLSLSKIVLETFSAGMRT